MQDNSIDAAHGAAPSMTPPNRRWVWTGILALLVALLLYAARSVLAPFVVAGVIAYVFGMVVDRIQERLRWPRGLVVALLYVLVLGAVALGLYFGAEGLYQETRQLVTRWPGILEGGVRQVMGANTFSFGGQAVDSHGVAARISQAIGDMLNAANAMRWVEEGTRLLLEGFVVVVVSFYLLLHGNRLGPYLLRFVPPESRDDVTKAAGRIHDVLGAYLRGQLVLILLVSTVTFLVLEFVFHIPQALPLGILSGFLEILPLVGPLVAAAIAASVAFSVHGAGAALGVLGAYLIIRQLEDHFVAPLVLGRSVNIHPVAAIFAVLAGGAIAGVLGMLLAVPAAAAAKVLLDYIFPDGLPDPDVALRRSSPEQHEQTPVRRAEDEETAEEISTSAEQEVIG